MTDSRMTTIPFSRVSPLISVVGPLAAIAASLAVPLPASCGDVVLTKREITSFNIDDVVDRFGPVFAADLDGDGDIDAISSAEYEPHYGDDEEIVWYESDGDVDILASQSGKAKTAWFENKHNVG